MNEDPWLYLPRYDVVSRGLCHHRRLLDASDLYADSGCHRLYDESGHRRRRDDAVRLFRHDAFSLLGRRDVFFLRLHGAFDPRHPVDVSSRLSRHRDFS